jgi:hypothetical protein
MIPLKNLLLVGLTAVALLVHAQELTVSADKASGVYEFGQTVHWQVEWKTNSPDQTAQFRLLNGGLTEVGHGELIFSNRVAMLESKFESPGTMLVEVKCRHHDSQIRATAVNTNLFYWKITLDNIRSTRIHGQLARPAQGEKFPALLVLQYASVYPLKVD